MHITYEEGRGVMSRLLQTCEGRQWQLTELAADAAAEHVAAGNSGVMLDTVGQRHLPRRRCWPASRA